MFPPLAVVRQVDAPFFGNSNGTGRAGGRLAGVLEGGCDLDAFQECVGAHVGTFAGNRCSGPTGNDDSFMIIQ